MKTVLLTDLELHPEAWHRALKDGTLRGGEVILGDESATSLPVGIATREWHTKPADSGPTAKPIRAWPFWARWLAKRRQPGDAGAGDTLARILGKVGADRAAKVWEQVTGTACGCSDRRGWLNGRYSYWAFNGPLLDH